MAQFLAFCEYISEIDYYLQKNYLMGLKGTFS